MLQISHISPKNRETIHEKSLHILENTGVAFDHEPALRLFGEISEIWSIFKAIYSQPGYAGCSEA